MDCKNDFQSLIDQVTSRVLAEIEAQSNLSEEELQNLETTEIDINQIIDDVSCELSEEQVYSEDDLDDCEACEPDLGESLPQQEFEVNDDEFAPNPAADAAKLLKCQAELDEYSKQIRANLEELVRVDTVLNKLIEFRDNLRVFDGYYKARVDSIAKVINLFQPLVEEIERNLPSQRAIITQEIKRLQELNSENFSEARRIQIEQKRNQIQAINDRIEEIREKIQRKVENDDVFSLKDKINRLNRSVLIEEDIRIVMRQTLGSDAIRLLRNSVRQYSGAIDVKQISFSIGDNINLSSVATRGVLRFELNFNNLEFFELERTVYNDDTGERIEIEEDLPIRNSEYLTDSSFFDSNAGVNINNSGTGSANLTGTLYTGYWNKFDDPINEFFTLDERGLTNERTLLDPNLIGTGLETIKEESKTYFISDLERVQNFYRDFESGFEERKNEVREQIVDPAFQRAYELFKDIGLKEVKTLLAAGRIDQELIDESQRLQSVIDSIEKGNTRFRRRLTILDEQIERLIQIREDLKKDPEVIKEEIRKIDCFSKQGEDDEEACAGKDKLGIDPIGVESIGAPPDPTLPNAQQFCYWQEHSKIVNRIGLTPLPSSSTQLRYWPVGFTFVSPAGNLVKIPLPIIWQPILTIPSPLGILVLYVTVCGLFVSPFLMYLKPNGKYQFIISAYGSSPEFGFDGDNVIKESIAPPLSAAAAIEAAAVAANPSQYLPKFPNGTPIPDYPGEPLSVRREELECLIENAKEKGDIKKLKKYTQELNQLKEFATPTTALLSLVAGVNKKNGIQDTLNDIRNKIAEKIDEAGYPTMEKVSNLQDTLQEQRNRLNEQLIQAREETDQERVKQLKEKLAEDTISTEQKLDAFINDLTSYINDAISLPTITLPKDTSKIDPKQNAIDRFKGIVKDLASDNKILFSTRDTFNIKSKLQNSISEISDSINFDDFEINSDGKINIDDNIDKIKARFKELTGDLFKKIKGEPQEGDSEEELERKKLIRASLGVTAAVLAGASSISSLFNAFKPCCAEPPFDLEEATATLPPEVAATFISAFGVVNGIIDSLDASYLKNLYGGVSSISPQALKSMYSKTVSDLVPNINLPTSIDVLNLGALAGFVAPFLALLYEPKAPIDVQTPVSVPKEVNIDLDIIKRPLTSIVTNFIKVEDLPVNIETDFLNIKPVDFKVYLRKLILDNIDDLLDTIEPFFVLLDVAKGIKGQNLNVFEAAQQNALPTGAPIKAKFTAESILKLSLPAASLINIPDLDKMKNALSALKPLEEVQKANPIPYLPYIVLANANQQQVARQSHPVLNADDTVPWERLSDSNFLLTLLIDDMINKAADQTGFYRNYL